jgi:hypothetical protein
MPAVPWSELVLFMSGVGFVALYGLTVSGHFPAEFRADELKGGAGAIIMWGTIVVTCVAAVTTLIVAWIVLPWYAIAIGGGAMLLAAPLLLRPFPDWFVNGRAGLLTFAAAATATAIVIWAAA